MTSIRYASTLPSFEPPIVIVCRWARPCVMAIRFSYLVSVHRTGRPSCLAIQQTMMCSGSAPNLAPNAPPTSGVMTRTSRLDAEMPGDGAFCALGALVGDPGDQAAVVAPDRGGGAAFHRGRRDPLVE